MSLSSLSFFVWFFHLHLTLYSRTPLIRINWDDKHPGLQKIRIIGFFFEYRLHWQFEVRMLLFTVCACV